MELSKRSACQLRELVLRLATQTGLVAPRYPATDPVGCPHENGHPFPYALP